MIDVTIRIDKAHAHRLDDIARALQSAGLTGMERHDRFQIINGSIADSKLAALRAVAGVASVREDRIYKTQGE